ncbi:MAG: hypothetical protein A2139_02940 [Desulfobacca sp. RBG_16_60_12]|nr:MAG: hypothetical protein A2139_02940 [Desulfobacca sp. RBG_16_60_12]
MKHAMIDVEALGNHTHGLVCSIGAVWFNPLSEEMVGEPKFKVNIRFQSALDGGAVVTGDTLRWWLEQSQEARGALFKPPPIDETAALEALRLWYKTTKCQAIWSHGSNYDLRLLRHAYERRGNKPPWHYRDEMDTRTLFRVLGMVRQGEEPLWPFNTKPHDALEDAICQAVAVQSALKKLKARYEDKVEIVGHPEELG